MKSRETRKTPRAARSTPGAYSVALIEKSVNSSCRHWPRSDEQDALRALGEQPRDHQPRLDHLAEAHLVREDAAAFGDALQREEHRVDLVRVRIDLRGALGCYVAALLRCGAQADEIFC